jgi:hypothetical protein
VLLVDAAAYRIARSHRRAARRLREVLPLVAGAGLLVFVVSQAPLGAIAGAAGRAGPLLLVVPIVALGWHACNTSAFRVLLDGQVPWRVLYWNRLVGDGYNNLVPLAGLGGEPFKLRHLSRYQPTDRVAAALICDRVIESAFGLVTTGLCLAYAVGSITMPSALRGALWAFVAGAFVVAILAALLVVSALPGRAGALVARLLGGGSPDALGRVGVRKLLRVLSWHVPGRLLGLLEIVILFALLGLPLTITHVVFTDSLLNAAGVVSFAIPQGLGVFEGTSVYLFGLLGHPGPLALAFALTRRGRLLIVSGLGVVLHLTSLPGARGRPRPAAQWDAEYANGDWRRLDTPRELGHYALIAAYVEQLTTTPRILDVGCGHGRLYRLLRERGLGSYLGIDISERAIEEARTLAMDGATFAVADFEADPPDGLFDVVIFNESIYYAAEPARVFARYLDLLDEGGIAIVSIRHRLRNRRLRAAIHRVRRPVHSSTVVNEARERWHVDVFAGRPPV